MIDERPDIRTKGTSDAVSADIAFFTYDALIEEIDRAHDRATEPGKPSWSKLRAVATDLAHPADVGFEPVGGRAWSLVEVSIEGYRGVGGTEPLVLRFDPTPGVTVLHGANGSGKSSIGDAIETALHGRPGGSMPPVGGTGFKAPLWEPVHHGRDASVAHVRLTLVHEKEKLHLGCTIDAKGDVTATKAELEVAGERSEVTLGTSWSEALASHQPVFAYASWERRIQLSKDLHDYLENLLALGGCFAALEAEVTRLGIHSTNALDDWSTALQAAVNSLDVADALYRRGDKSDLLAVPEPSVHDDINEWIVSNQLTELGDSSTEITEVHELRLTTVAEEVLSATEALASASASLHKRLAEPLHALDSAVSALDDPGHTCPVCSTDGVRWADALHAQVGQLTGLDAPRARAMKAVRDLRDVNDNQVGPIIAVCDDSIGQTEDIRESLLTVSSLASSFRSATDDHGVGPKDVVTGPARALSAWLLTQEAHKLVHHAIEHSNHLRQWHRARTAAVTEFSSVWRANRSDAMQAASWSATKKRVEDLRGRLRNRRTEALKTRASDRVQHLLADVGLSIGALSIQKKTANMELLDTTGQPLELGMLSAGQRNAVLLAPLLATADGGPFGFLVLDDPVHAFDELRVDRLARAIEQLAQDRRVVVLTHDERLREHLMARPLTCDSRSVNRESDTGAVTVEVRHEMWRTLLDDARAILSMAVPIPGATLTVTQTIRALCRQAIDNAVRDLVVRNAIRLGRSVEVDLSTLDAALLTKHRLNAAATLCPAQPGDPHTVAAAVAMCAMHLKSWNQGSHGNVDQTTVTLAEIDIAFAACTELVECSR